MVGPARFRIAGREVSPLAVAPWSDEPAAASLPPILQRLRGEWPCVPFGIAGGRELPAEWCGTGEEPDPLPHGHSSNAVWSLHEQRPDRVVLDLAYPDNHPIRSLRRTVTAAEDAARLDFTLEISARRAATLPIGIHPTSALPGAPGDNRLVLDAAARCWTPPAPAEPGISTMAIDARNVSAAAVPLAAGGTLDVTRLPLAHATEELLLVTRPGGRVRLECPTAGYAVTIVWDTAVFASCLLWISNRGRTAYPWSGRHLALGIEPVTAAFDLGTAVSANPGNPLARDGVPTAMHVAAGRTVTTRYAIVVEHLG